MYNNIVSGDTHIILKTSTMKGANIMSSRDYAKSQIDILPDNIVNKVVEFISFQRFSLGLYDSDDEYLAAIPGMTESIKEGLATPLSECVPISEVWPDV